MKNEKKRKKSFLVYGISLILSLLFPVTFFNNFVAVEKKKTKKYDIHLRESLDWL